MNSRTLAHLAFAVALCLAVRRGEAVDPSRDGSAPTRIGPPPAGKLYHGVFPGGKSGDEDDVTAADVQSYEKLAGQRVAWVYFSNNWYRSRRFPAETATWIRQGGAVPFVRLMLRSSSEENEPEPLYTLEAITDGKFDADLAAWGKDAKTFGTALLVEYGTECNGEWFSWNGKWHGEGRKGAFGDPNKPEGPQRFVAAYRHIVATIRAAGADNITWVFHADVADDPDIEWNHLENYYPGDDVVDWIGLSCYGAQTPTDEEQPEPLRTRLDPAYQRVVKLAPTKPIMLLEFGCTAGHPKVKPDQWAAAALDDLLSNRWPKVAGFSWWNERWENDDDKADDTTMRLQDIPAMATVFHDRLERAANRLQTRPDPPVPATQTASH